MNEDINKNSVSAEAGGEDRAKGKNFVTEVLGENPIVDGGNRYAPYLSRSILLEEAAPPKNVRAIINVIAIFIAGLILLSAVITVDERAQGTGEILPIGFVQPVQHFEGGIISDVLVEEGEYVTEGQPLILLDRTASAAEYGSLRARHAALSLEVERLTAFATGRTPDFGEIGGQYPTLAAEQMSVYQSQLDAQNAQISILQNQKAQLQDQYRGLLEQIKSSEAEVGFIREEVELRRTLVEQGLSSRLLFLQAQRDLARTESQLADIRTEASGIAVEIERSDQQILEIVTRNANAALTRVGAASSERAQVASQLSRLEDRVRRTSITAPISGRIKGLIVRPTGGVITSGEQLMEIVPQEDELIAEVRISPRDIGHIRPGQETFVRVETFNFARYGSIPGTVETVSASSFENEEGEYFFKALIRLERSFVGEDEIRRISPGMTVVADIQTGSKTILEYLTRPVANTLADSFGER